MINDLGGDAWMRKYRGVYLEWVVAEYELVGFVWNML